MPDGNDEHDAALPSVQPHVHAHRPPQLPSSRPSSSSDRLPLDRAAPLTCSSPPTSFLPATTYDPDSSDSQLQQQYFSPNGAAEDTRFQQTPSPDPSEFYRPYVVEDAQKSAGLGRLLPSDIDPGMTSITSAPRNLPVTSKNLDPPLHNQSSTARSYQFRSVSGSSISSGDSVPRQPTSFRNRQTSFKDLIDRFNQNTDQTPPIPARSSSRPPSRPPSPSPKPRRLSHRDPSVPRTAQHQRTEEPLSSPSSSTQDIRHKQLPLYPPATLPIEASGVEGSESRRLLFGELLPIDTGAAHAAGYGIASHRPRRRGSDSSVPSPNPLLIDRRAALDNTVSPSSPTAWYLSSSPSLEGVAVSQPNFDTRQHRRSRSDASWSSPNFPTPDPLTDPMAVASFRGPVAATSPVNNPHSKSRIPISSRRASHASESGSSSSPSTRPSSAMGVHTSPSHVPLAPKGSSRLPKPLTISMPEITSPDKKSRASSGIKSPNRRDIAHSHGSPSQIRDKGSLKVYVSAPPPMMSPPLRSSRPRKQVSTASTAASRAKVVDRVSRFQSSPVDADNETRNPRPRTRKLPELGNVDFAARRQRIQQAFNKSVEESAKKEEEAAERRRIARYRRDEEVRSMLIREGELRKMASMESPLTPVQPPLNHSNSFRQINTVEENRGSSPLASEPTPTVTPSLTIDTSGGSFGHQPEPPKESSHLDLDDSPTLGMPTTPNANPPEQHPPSSDDCTSDIPPYSAVTAATNGSDTTNFDPEPQTHLDHQESHRNILNRIMQLRESSSSSECDEDEEDEEPCDNDEKESIQIMLDPNRGTFFFDRPDTGDSNDTEDSKIDDETDAATHDDQPKRWSMASWASSARDQQSISELQGDAGSQDKAITPADPVDVVAQSIPHWNESAGVSYNQMPSDFLHNKDNMGPVTHRRQQSHPDNLIRQGRWDSKRVTQLYLQELVRGRFRQPLDRPWEVLQPEEAAEAQSKTNSLTDEPVVVPRVRELSSQDQVSHRASLSLRDDWESASPSIADWMQVAAGGEAPAAPPRSDVGNNVPKDDAKMQASVRTHSQTTQPKINGSWDGLGLAIDVQSPADDAAVVPPPKPDHSPPPVPVESEHLSAPDPQTALPQTVSPSVYASQPPNNPATSLFPSVEEPIFRHSEDSYLTQAGFTPSPPTLASSATSQHQNSSSQLVSDVPQSGSPTPEQKQLKQRRNVIKELVDTEYTYGRDMKVVDDIYRGTSSSCLDLSVDDVRNLFANSDQVVQFSMNFQDALKQAAKSVYVMPKSQRWSSKRGTRSTRGGSPAESQNSVTDSTSVEQDERTFIGHAFMEHMSQMEKVYSDYLKNHEVANKTLQTLQRNPKVEIWLKECRDWAMDLTEAWNLDALLVKPVQRLVKYPLLLSQLINATPETHPDHASLVKALEAVTNISVRINDLKKRADVVGQVVSSRKRKESDVRSGFTKAFGRRTEKLRQQVGLSEMHEDPDYNALSTLFNENFFQLQVVMRDVEMYTREIKTGMDQFNEYVLAIQGCIDVAQSNHTEMESKWNRLRMYVREVMNIALPEHITAVRKGVIDPMLTLLKLYDGPQKVMTKRTKRLLDYARYKAVKDRGDKPDKKTTEQGEQFSVLNEALKDELPKLFNLTAKLMEACLKKFVGIQQDWYQLLQQKISPVLDRFPAEMAGIVSDWSADFSFADAQIMSLALCNGALLSEASSLGNFNAPTADGTASPRRPSTVTNTSSRTASVAVESSPKVSYDLGNSGASIHSHGFDGQSDQINASQPYMAGANHVRTNSSISGPNRPGVAEIPNGYASTGALANAMSPRPSTSSVGRSGEPFPAAPQLSLDMPFMRESLLHETNTFESAPGDTTASPARFSGFFSSALPMSDSPRQDVPAPKTSAPSINNSNPKVLFLAASLYEFNIDKSRREAGYPYLTYIEGEVFDVIAEKGELWLARNQDDPSGQVGWIWTQHFAKVPS